MAPLPLSYGQRSLWFLQQFAPEGGAYNVTIPIRILAALDVPRIRRCFERIVERYPMLRARYLFDGRQPSYEIISNPPWSIEQIAMDGATEEEVAERATQHTHQLFSIDRAPVFRLAVFSRSPTDHFLTFTTHHLNSDLFSLANMIEDLFALYGAADGEEVSLPPIEATFDDYVRWQAALLSGPEGERQWSYWSKKLAGTLPSLALPSAKKRPAVQTHNGAVLVSQVPPDVASQLRATAKAEGTTLFMALLAVYYVLLHEFSGQQDLLVGTPVPGRRGDPKFERVMGTFINVLTLRTRLDGDPTLRETAQRVSTTVREARENQDIPFPMLVERLRPPRDTSRTPLFQAYFTLQRLSTHQEWLGFFLPSQQNFRTFMGEAEVGTIPLSQQEGQMEISVHVYDINGQLFPEFKYNTDIFEQPFIERLSHRYHELLQAFTQDPTLRLSQLRVPA